MSLFSFTAGRMVSLLVLSLPTSLPFVGISGTDDRKVLPGHHQWYIEKVKYNMQSNHPTMMGAGRVLGALLLGKVFLCICIE